MGILDVFDPYYANLRKISNENFFLSRVIHKAEIEVTEEGTVASAASGTSLFTFRRRRQGRGFHPQIYILLNSLIQY